MKRLWALLALVLLSACGGGASSSNSVTTFVDTANLPKTAFMVTIATGTAGPAKGFSSFTPGIEPFAPSDHLRIVMTNDTLRSQGRPFSLIKDVNPGESLEITEVPVAQGYTVEALAYNRDQASGLNKVIGYAVARKVSVDDSGGSGATLSLFPVQASLVLPSSVVQGARYNVLANFSTAGGRRATPLQEEWFLNPPRTTSYAPFANNTSATTYAASHSYTAHWVAVPTPYYYQGVFTVRPNLLAPGESPRQWVYNAPEATMTVTAPITLVITLPDN